MAQTSKETLEIRDLSKGMNTFDPETAVPEGYYVDAQNMLLTEKSPVTIGGLTKLNTTAAPDSRVISWFEPFSTPDTGTHSDVAHSDAAHSDAAHSDAAHGDVAHSDNATHSDVAHSDTAHSDSHSDVAHGDSDAKQHSDTPHADAHSDAAHSDIAHSDTSHSDTAHTDTAHADIAHTDTAHSDIAHSDTIASALMIAHLDRGAGTDGDGSGIWSYNPNNDTWSHLWTQAFTTAAEAQYRTSNAQVTSVPYRGRLVWAQANVNDKLQDTLSTTNTLLTDDDSGTEFAPDNPMKHDGRYVQPVGSMGHSFDVPSAVTGSTTRFSDQRVAAFETAAPFGESWTGGTATTAGGNRKDFDTGRSLPENTLMTLNYLSSTWADEKDFLTGLMGAPNFGADDWFVIWVKPTAVSGTPTIRFRFGNAAMTVLFSFTTAALTLTANHWYEYRVRRSQFVLTGSPVWSSIEAFDILISNVAGNTYVFDAAYWEYKNRPTARGAVLEVFNQQLVVADLFDAKTTLKFSNVGSPDYFDPAIGVAEFDGGRLTLGEQDRITSLWAYFDELIVGKTSSSWTFSGTGANVSISALPLTIGVAGAGAIVETPWSLHYFFDSNIFGARLTSRGLVSTNINSLLQDMDLTQGHRHRSMRNDKSHTVRWSFRTNAATLDRNDLGLIYDYQLDAWCSVYTPRISHYTSWVNYATKSRQILTAMYDGFFRVADLGTSFDGTAIASYVTLPWKQNPTPQQHDNVVQWMDATLSLTGTASVLVEARFADDPHEFDAAVFATYGTVLATPDGDKGYVQFGRTSRWMQLRLRATSLSFGVDLPIVIGFNSRPQRV